MKTITLIAAAFALAFSGCATTNPKSPGEEKAIFDDLPPAEGMKYMEGYGHRSQSGSIREYTQLYQGSRRVDDIRRFYEQALPVHHWELKGAEGQNPATLTFVKKAERVTVRLEDRGGVLSVTVRVTGKD